MSERRVDRVLEYETAIARTKSYTGQAVITLILYLFFWIPGIIANILFLLDAREMEKRAGETLPGVGCLTMMLVAQAVVILGAGACFVLFFIVGPPG